MSKPLILIIEDDDASAEALSLVLRDWGAEVLRAPNGPALRDNAFDELQLRYIIADYDLGDGPDGVALARCVMQTARNASALVLSGFFRVAEAEASAAAAGFEILQKPVQPGSILAWLDRN